MIDEAFLETLACPYCRGPLTVWRRVDDRCDGPLTHAVVRCACYRYPIVDGILVLRQISGPSDTDDVAVAHLERGDVACARAHLEAVASMVPAPGPTPTWSAAGLRNAASSAVHRLRALTSRQPDAAAPTPHDDSLLADLARTRPGGFRAYLFQRYANPSFVASIAAMSMIEAVEQPASGRTHPAVLDIGCGIGHSTAMLMALFPTAEVVAADPDFVNLQLLRRHMAPSASCVCVDAELPLPFADDQFDASVCLDAFHYIRSKWALSRELDRVVDRSGVWIFPHLHNALASNVAPGIPLPPDDYLRMTNFAAHSWLLDEAAVLEGLFHAGTFDLESRSRIDTDSVEGAPNLVMAATNRDDLPALFQVGRLLVAASRRGTIAINPLYSVEPRDSNTSRLHATWLDPALQAECAAITQFMPETVEVATDVAHLLESGAPMDAIDRQRRDVVESLLGAMVLIPLPADYRRGFQAQVGA